MHEDDSGSLSGSSASAVRIEQLRGLLLRMDAAHDAQRGQLARELHHKVVGSLSAAKMECDFLLRPERADEALRARLQRLSDELGQTIQFTRQLIGELWPAIVAHLGLAAAVQEQIAETRARSGAHVELAVEGDVDGISEKAGIVMYRLAQQVLTCAAEAQRAGEARIVLRRIGQTAHMHVEMKPSSITDEDWLLLQERVARQGGQCTREFAPSGATVIHVVLPAAV
jgi:signal transduction histidine kinase